MVSVCPRHIKNGLDVLDIPHVTKISNEEERSKTCKCAFCHLDADYKLHNDLPYLMKKNKLASLKEMDS
ncbi:hypothetical protein BTR23_02920 [Alkalihalophilus pseudofirmus]|uniref:hypothetical protein n=1 Tax=Alkalihalobacterium alkalinitrilicum TaxID=427920 RepID=UPI00094C7955|nr:hypothetical protein [Alkalihalobacterium alkalinitrilicum]OLO42190.1 hypothetical protein BTR23_02920 [Alkalihalophilus pseudofirmus]